MQVAAFNPLAVNEADVPVDILAREKDIIEAKAKESGKPEAVIEKMITGGLQKYLNEVTLVNQPYVMDNDKKVGDVLKSENATVVSFKRLEVGEGIEKSKRTSLLKLLLLKPLPKLNFKLFDKTQYACLLGFYFARNDPSFNCKNRSYRVK